MSAKILVPIDFSPGTKTVLSWAASLARDRKATLILLHVQEPPIDQFVGEIYFPPPVLENPAIREALDKVKPEDPAVSCEHRLLLGAAPTQIVQLAADEKVDLIVMGSHGRGWLGRVLMGSVAAHVMRHAACPVLVVKASCAPADEPAAAPAAVRQA